MATGKVCRIRLPGVARGLGVGGGGDGSSRVGFGSESGHRSDRDPSGLASDGCRGWWGRARVGVRVYVCLRDGFGIGWVCCLFVCLFVLYHHRHETLILIHALPVVLASPAHSRVSSYSY